MLYASELLAENYLIEISLPKFFNRGSLDHNKWNTDSRMEISPLQKIFDVTGIDFQPWNETYVKGTALNIILAYVIKNFK